MDWITCYHVKLDWNEIAGDTDSGVLSLFCFPAKRASRLTPVDALSARA
ncbi:hypothetical protein O9992_26560 [Vibrio lentus]|nr:hypothetical protein [Vibrio lentus]